MKSFQTKRRILIQCAAREETRFWLWPFAVTQIPFDEGLVGSFFASLSIFPSLFFLSLGSMADTCEPSSSSKTQANWKLEKSLEMIISKMLREKRATFISLGITMRNYPDSAAADSKSKQDFLSCCFRLIYALAKWLWGPVCSGVPHHYCYSRSSTIPN